MARKAARTWLTDAAHAADPAWRPTVAAKDRATPRSVHWEPTLQSDLRNDDWGASFKASRRSAFTRSLGLLRKQARRHNCTVNTQLRQLPVQYEANRAGFIADAQLWRTKLLDELANRIFTV